MADYRSSVQAVVQALSRSFGEQAPPLWPDLAPLSKPEVSITVSDDLSASVELAWGTHKESFVLTPQEVALLHDGLHDLMRKAYERVVVNASPPPDPG
jgi:hypothetical protein